VLEEAWPTSAEIGEEGKEPHRGGAGLQQRRLGRARSALFRRVATRHGGARLQDRRARTAGWLQGAPTEQQTGVVIGAEEMDDRVQLVAAQHGRGRKAGAATWLTDGEHRVARDAHGWRRPTRVRCSTSRCGKKKTMVEGGR
jgi:hypothetical protein